MAYELVLPYPTKKQLMAIKTSTKYTGFGGARGGGKSYFVDIDAIRRCINWPEYTCTIIRRTHVELYENHTIKLMKLLKIGQLNLAKYNDQKKQFVFANGSRIVLKYCDGPKDLKNFQGLQSDAIYLDEATQFEEQIWTELKPCLRGENGYEKRFYLTCNPGGPGMGWFKRLFIDRNFLENEDPNDYGFIQSLVTDNIPLLKAQPDYVAQLRSLPAKLRKAWLEGDWNILEGQFFEEFRAAPDVVAANKAGVMLDADELRKQRRWTHVIDPIDLSYGEPSEWTIFRSYDFGYSKPFSCAWWAVDFEGTMYRIMEFYGCTENANEGVRLTPEQQFKEIRRIEHDHPWLRGKEIHGVADPAIWDESRGESINETAIKNGIFFSKGSNARIAGWMQVHYRFQFSEHGIPRMYIFSNCKDFIRTIPLLMYDEHKVEDLDTSLEDHIADETRYACMSRPIAPIKIMPKEVHFSDPLNMFSEDKYGRY